MTVEEYKKLDDAFDIAIPLLEETKWKLKETNDSLSIKSNSIEGAIDKIDGLLENILDEIRPLRIEHCSDYVESNELKLK